MKNLPAVDFLARQLLRRLKWELVDLILLFWLYSNPYETRRRSLASLIHVLKHIPEFQRPDGKPNVTEEELTQIVLAAIERLKKKKYINIYSKNKITAQVSLTENGIEFIRTTLSPEDLQFLDESGHCT